VIPKRLTIAGLLVLVVWLLAAPPAGPTTAFATRLLIGAACAAPLLILLAAGRRAVRQWGVWVAIVMIPYFALSVGALLVSPGQRLPGATLATLIALVFFCGIATSRRPL
jgi:uncharacterized membrane protein